MGQYRTSPSKARRRHLSRISSIANQKRWYEGTNSPKKDSESAVSVDCGHSSHSDTGSSTSKKSALVQALKTKLQKTEQLTQKFKSIADKSRAQLYNSNKKFKRLQTRFAKLTSTLKASKHKVPSVELSEHAECGEACANCDHTEVKITALRKQRDRLLKAQNALRMRYPSHRLLKKFGEDVRPSPRSRVDVGELKERFPNLLRVKEAGGVIAPKARRLIQNLVALGIPHKKVYPVCVAVCEASQTQVEGTFDSHSVARIVREGYYVAAAVQVVHELKQAEAWTGSADGTGHKHIEHISHHAYISAPPQPSIIGDHDPSPSSSVPQARPRQFYMGTRAVPNKTSETQLDTFDTLVTEFVAYYNESPEGRKQPMEVHEMLAKLKGWGSDHAEDQKKFVRLLREWKRRLEREKRGEKTLYTLASAAPATFLAHLLHASDEMVQSVGGMDNWERLTGDEQDACAQPILIRMAMELFDPQDVSLQYPPKVGYRCQNGGLMQLGEAAFNALSPEDRELVDRFVWAGCSMHKDLNAAKGGNTAMQEFWKIAQAEPPIPLPSRDNAAALTLDPESSTGNRATTVTQGGAVKLVQLCGLVFNHHDDKKGQQDTYRNYYEEKLSYIVQFPETSNTRFQSHCVAACELLVHLPLYISFLDLVRDKKEKRSFNNIEHNIYQGLHDPSTLTELAVLALYAQAISHPYMRVVRGHGHWNALKLGPFHHSLLSHCEAIIANPDLLLAPDASHIKGSLDGALWERPAAFYAVHKLASQLPCLRGALVAFMTGALETWRRFCSEFDANGQIARMSPAEREKIAICATNDANESQLGRKRVLQRRAPNKTELTHNAEVMYATNGTADFIESHLNTPSGQAFLRKAGRALDESGHQSKVRKRLVQHDKEVVEGKRKKDAENQEKAQRLNEKLDKVQPVLDITTIESWRDNKKITVAHHINPQLQWHKREDRKGVKVTSGKTDFVRPCIERHVQIQQHYISGRVSASIDMRFASPILGSARFRSVQNATNVDGAVGALSDKCSGQAGPQGDLATRESDASARRLNAIGNSKTSKCAALPYTCGLSSASVTVVRFAVPSRAACHQAAVACLPTVIYPPGLLSVNVLNGLYYDMKDWLYIPVHIRRTHIPCMTQYECYIQWTGNRGQKIDALITAVKEYHSRELERGLEKEVGNGQQAEYLTYNSDCEDMEEELLHE
ncbi:hypothetical protein K474DRAFT_1701902 [Panus rudis PR-1116 ss-1]|nr:hypothetical protein K474DRAFT_1701902 [Panus rudis PR-1116 ss-1]